MKTIYLSYHENLRENLVTSVIYGKLKDAGFNPLSVNTEYNFGLRKAIATYEFDDGNFPKDSDLAKILSSNELFASVRQFKFPERKSSGSGTGYSPIVA